jgi:hypothetical protein
VALASLAVVYHAYTLEPEFARHPDEAAHFVTGALVHDWIADGFPRPLSFAREYYARYPKVALGHWPPFFYGLQGAWYTVFGVSRFSTFLLVGSVACAFLLLLFECLRRRLGLTAALAAVSLVLTSPVFHYSASLFMADLLVATLGLGAMWAYARFLETGHGTAAVGFGLLSALAILTKQDSVALAAVPLLSLLLLRRWSLLKDWRFYLPAVIVLVLCGPVYVFTQRFSQAAWASLQGPRLGAKLMFLLGGLTLVSWASAVVTALGAVVLLVRRLRPSKACMLPVVMLAGSVGVAAMQLMTPVSLDPRYLTALLAPAALLAACAFHLVNHVRVLPAGVRLGGIALVVVLLALGHSTYEDRRVTGYQAVAATFAGERPGPELVLVCSDPMGDGALAAEFRLQHGSRNLYLLRGDKMLASSTWMGKNYRLRHTGADELEAYLIRQPVHYILLDEWGEESGPHYENLRRLVAEYPERFPLVGTYAVSRQQEGRKRERSVRVYVVAANKTAIPDALEFEIPGLPGGEHIRVPSTAPTRDRSALTPLAGPDGKRRGATPYGSGENQSGEGGGPG